MHGCSDKSKENQMFFLWWHIRELIYSSAVLDLGTRWILVVNFNPRPLYHCGKSP
jgi:hypothetical protein